MAYTTDKNGNWKRTVRCGYCYEVGHNKSSCPQKKQHHKDMIAEYERELAEDNFKHDYDRDYTQRKLDRHKAELSKSINRGKHRKCSYCGEEGHTRRTCKHRKSDMSDWANKAIIARRKFVDKMEEIGLGVGALAYKHDYYGKATELVMIESIKWDSMDHTIAVGQEFQYVDLIRTRDFHTDERYPNGRTFTHRLPFCVSNIDGEDTTDHNSARMIEVVSPCNHTVPDDFYTIDSVMKSEKTIAEFKNERPWKYIKA